MKKIILHITLILFLVLGINLNSSFSQCKPIEKSISIKKRERLQRKCERKKARKIKRIKRKQNKRHRKLQSKDVRKRMRKNRRLDKRKKNDVGS